MSNFSNYLVGFDEERYADGVSQIRQIFGDVGQGEIRTEIESIGVVGIAATDEALTRIRKIEGCRLREDSAHTLPPMSGTIPQ